MTHALATGTGILYIVATPIGNRDDITLRALNVLKSVDLILAEDTRHSLPLLHALGIKNTVRALHAHNENEKSAEIIEHLLAGKNIALISDAGTPLISDPGYPLVHLARQQGIAVTPIPGACALVAALCAAGIPCDSFLFSGFLPAKQSARKNKLAELKALPHTLVFYESTHRILDCLNDIGDLYGEECPVVLAKELTKTFERFIYDSVHEVKNWLLAEPSHAKGEFVLIIPPRPIEEKAHSNETLLSILLKELPLKQAVQLASTITQGNKNDLYELALKLKNA